MGGLVEDWAGIRAGAPLEGIGRVNGDAGLGKKRGKGGGKGEVRWACERKMRVGVSAGAPLEGIGRVDGDAGLGGREGGREGGSEG